MKNVLIDPSLAEQRYITTDGLLNSYGISKSVQAKWRMHKQIPYVRPAGSRLVLYDVLEIEKWLKSWSVVE